MTKQSLSKTIGDQDYKLHSYMFHESNDYEDNNYEDYGDFRILTRDTIILPKGILGDSEAEKVFLKVRVSIKNSMYEYYLFLALLRWEEVSE